MPVVDLGSIIKLELVARLLVEADLVDPVVLVVVARDDDNAKESLLSQHLPVPFVLLVAFFELVQDSVGAQNLREDLAAQEDVVAPPCIATAFFSETRDVEQFISQLQINTERVFFLKINNQTYYFRN